MACLMNFNWIKLPRDTLPEGKGIMGEWAQLAAHAAFRPGQADYCGPITIYGGYRKQEAHLWRYLKQLKCQEN